MDWRCPSGPPGSSPEASRWESWVGRLRRRRQGLEAQAHFPQAALEPYQRLPGKQAARPPRDSVSEWAPRWGTGCPAVGCSPCPGRGCWCAAVWKDQTARKWCCTGHLAGTGAGCCARWDSPSRTQAPATLEMPRVLLGPGAQAADTGPLLPLQGSHSSASWTGGRAGCQGRWSQPGGSGHEGWDTLYPHLETHSCAAPGRMLGSSWELRLHSRTSPGQGTLGAHTCPRGTRHRSSPHALPRLPSVASSSCSQAAGYGGARRQAPAGAAGARVAPGAGGAYQPHSPSPPQPPSPAAAHRGLPWAVLASPHRQGTSTAQAALGLPGSPPPGSLGGGSQSLHWWVSPAQAGRGTAPRTASGRGASSPRRAQHSPGGPPHRLRKPAAASPGSPLAGSSLHWGPRRVPGSPGGRSSGG